MWKPTLYGGYLDEMPFSTLQSAVPDYPLGTSLEHPGLQFKRNPSLVCCKIYWRYHTLICHCHKAPDDKE